MARPDERGPAVAAAEHLVPGAGPLHNVFLRVAGPTGNLEDPGVSCCGLTGPGLQQPRPARQPAARAHPRWRSAPGGATPCSTASPWTGAQAPSKATSRGWDVGEAVQELV